MDLRAGGLDSPSVLKTNLSTSSDVFVPSSVRILGTGIRSAVPAEAMCYYCHISNFFVTTRFFLSPLMSFFYVTQSHIL